MFLGPRSACACRKKMQVPGHDNGPQRRRTAIAVSLILWGKGGGVSRSRHCFCVTVSGWRPAPDFDTHPVPDKGTAPGGGCLVLAARTGIIGPSACMEYWPSWRAAKSRFHISRQPTPTLPPPSPSHCEHRYHKCWPPTWHSDPGRRCNPPLRRSRRHNSVLADFG